MSSLNSIIGVIGAAVGVIEGRLVGFLVDGAALGVMVGVGDVGACEGDEIVGFADGILVGKAVGYPVGSLL